MSNMARGTQQVAFPMVDWASSAASGCHSFACGSLHRVNCFSCRSQPRSKHSRKPPHILLVLSYSGNALRSRHLDAKRERDNDVHRYINSQKDAPVIAALGAAAAIGLGSEAFVASKPVQVRNRDHKCLSHT